MMPSLPWLGGCNCASIRYRVSKPGLTCYICHCHLCQKRTGSAFSMSIVLQADGIDLLQGTLERSERSLPSGGTNASFTCSACHSRLWTARGGSRTVNLRVGTLDDTGNIAPVAQIWTSSAQAWAVQPDLLSYAEQPGDYAPLLAAWRVRQEGTR